METHPRREGLDLIHIVGEGMGHKYDDTSINAINAQMDAWLSKPKIVIRKAFASPPVPAPFIHALVECRCP